MPKSYAMTEGIHLLKVPVDATSSAWASAYMDMSGQLSASFLVMFGALTGTSTDDAVTLTVECSSANSSNASEAQVPFNYRVSGALNTDTWGAVTAATASGGAVATKTTNASMMYLINVDGVDIYSANSLGRWVRVVGSVTASVTADAVAVIAITRPRYAQTTMVSTS